MSNQSLPSETAVVEYSIAPRDSLRMFVVHRSPADYPGFWVLRVWRIGSAACTAEGPALVRFTREGIIAHIPPGLAMILPDASDDSSIQEIWV